MSTESSTAPTGGLLRVYWMLIGNALLALAAMMIARLPTWTFTWRDGVFGIALAALVWCRWADAARGGTSAQGEVMTPEMLRRWILGAIAIGVGMWLLSQSIEL